MVTTLHRPIHHRPPAHRTVANGHAGSHHGSHYGYASRGVPTSSPAPTHPAPTPPASTTLSVNPGVAATTATSATSHLTTPTINGQSSRAAILAYEKAHGHDLSLKAIGARARKAGLHPTIAAEQATQARDIARVRAQLAARAAKARPAGGRASSPVAPSATLAGGGSGIVSGGGAPTIGTDNYGSGDLFSRLGGVSWITVAEVGAIGFALYWVYKHGIPGRGKRKGGR